MSVQVIVDKELTTKIDLMEKWFDEMAALNQWQAVDGHYGDDVDHSGEGPTAKEAVARLYLEINKNT